MQNNSNLLDRLALVYGQSTIYPFLTAELIVCEPSSGYTLPDPDAYARRMAEQAEAWLAHARDRSRMKDGTLVSKALHSLAFSFRHRAHDLAVPSKLSGTAKHQPALWRLTRDRTPFGTPLNVVEERDGNRVRLVVSFEGDVLGEVQSRHVGWLRPLVPFGAGVWLTRITGHEERYTLGCNVALGRVGHAVAALNHALGYSLNGNGYGGDGAATALVDVASVEARPLPAHGGDGDDDVAQVQGPDAPTEIRFWRDNRGTLCMSVPHIIKHSPTGPEVGYRGSGPADAALSVLCSVTSRGEADRFYQRYKEEVIAQMPVSGGVVPVADVLRWLAAVRAE